MVTVDVLESWFGKRTLIFVQVVTTTYNLSCRTHRPPYFS